MPTCSLHKKRETTKRQQEESNKEKNKQNKSKQTYSALVGNNVKYIFFSRGNEFVFGCTSVVQDGCTAVRQCIFKFQLNMIFSSPKLWGGLQPCKNWGKYPHIPTIFASDVSSLKFSICLRLESMLEIFSGKCVIVFQVPTALQLKCDRF